MKPSEIRNVLEDHEVRPSKSLGQNFLTDENVARWIVGQLEIQPQDCVVEVGPGTGALTEHAAPLCRNICQAIAAQRKQALRRRIAFGMHACSVQWHFAFGQPQKAGALLVCLRAKLCYL